MKLLISTLESSPQIILNKPRQVVCNSDTTKGNCQKNTFSASPFIASSPSRREGRDFLRSEQKTNKSGNTKAGLKTDNFLGASDLSSGPHPFSSGWGVLATDTSTKFVLLTQKQGYPSHYPDTRICHILLHGQHLDCLQQGPEWGLKTLLLPKEDDVKQFEKQLY